MPAVDRRSSPDEKVVLFRSLFRGRQDIYARRFESRRTGKSGYAPVCDNEWIRGVCDKRAVKCSQCSNRRFLPVTDEVIGWHLTGQDEAGRDFVMGLYPMLLDEKCFLLAADFDKDSWQEDTGAFLETCFQMQLTALLERSRSGAGGHVWLFFEEAIGAGLARRLGSHILTETMERRPDVGLDSYDRFFPNQDTLPKGGFGNLIALPLQKCPRESGNSVFLDESFQPCADQWARLAKVEPIATSQAEAIIRDAERKGRVIAVRLAPTEDDDSFSGFPWCAPSSRRRKESPITGPVPRSIELVLSDQVYIAKADLTAGLRNRLIRLAAFQNPEFYKAQSMRLPTYDKPRIIACAEDYPEHIALPRGCLDEIRMLLADLNIKHTLIDKRCTGQRLDVTFQGRLRPEQMTAAKAMLAHDIGVISATTAFGKTVLAIWLIAQRKTNTLVLVHRKQLMEQWIDRLAAFLDIPPKSIGRIGGGRKKPTGSLDVAMIQSLVRKGVVDDHVGEYGHLIVDECHHLSAQSFEQAARRAKAKFITGLSATVTRKDGHHPIIFMQCGPIRHSVDAKTQARRRPFAHTVHVRPTGFHSPSTADPDARMQFQQLYSELIADENRNDIIRSDVVQAVGQGRWPIVLTERREHLDQLVELLSAEIKHLIVLRGGMGKKAYRTAIDKLAALDEDEPRVLLATGRYIGEGFDDARLDTLFLTLPVSWRGTIAQYAGRLHRLHDRKREVRIYDYADLNVPMLSRMFDRRCRGYEAVGYSILLPASAVPGWPTDIPLPVDPQWKQNYAASVRRLVRDGVDVPLAHLFVQAAGPDSPETTGIARARSATEAFIYRRLETLEETSGKFQLNVNLPIPFDGMGKMEVDLLCAEARLAIELDGDQHLDDLQTYRRDRRKDALLQENGYFILRFLARDASQNLDDVLDTILRRMGSKRR
ncbi:MAG: DEAD/DEAH box helicase family protein [Phycisphaerae bacterium]|nr:DEAD/DEAH box helicase family protein [Phycisphaerae bacterium]